MRVIFLEKMRLEPAVEGWAEFECREEQRQGEGKEIDLIKIIRMEFGRNNKALTPSPPPIANIY